MSNRCLDFVLIFIHPFELILKCSIRKGICIVINATIQLLHIQKFGAPVEYSKSDVDEIKI